MAFGWKYSATPASGTLAGPGSYVGVDTAGGFVLVEGDGTGGDVTGPGSATDNALVRFDGAGGKTIQNSAIIINDFNNVSGMGTLGCGAITTTGKFSGSSTMEVVGNTVIVGDLSVSGTFNAPGDHVVGSLSASSTLQVVGATILGSTLGVTGAITVGESKVIIHPLTGITSVASQGGYSGSSTIQTVGNTILGGDLNVSGTFTQAGGTNQGSITSNGVLTANGGIKATSYSGSATLHSDGAVTLGSTLHVTGNITSTNGNISTDNGNISVGGAGSWNKGPGGGIAVSGYVSGSSTLEVVGASNLQGTVTLSGSLTGSKGKFDFANGNVIASGSYYGDGSNLTGITAEWDGTTTNAMSGSSTLQVVGAAEFGSTLATSGAVTAIGGLNVGAGPSATINAAGNIAGAAITGTTYSGSSTIQSVGKAYFGHNVYVTGGITAEALVAANAGVMSTTYSGSSTLQAVGNAIIGGNLSVSGNIATAATGDCTANRGFFTNALTVTNGTAAFPTVTATAAISGATSVTAGTFVGGNLNRHFINELTMSRPSVSTIMLHPGQCTDSTNTVYMDLTASVTLNIATTGIDALDTGSEATSTWYAVYVVSGASGMGGLLSTNETSPTMPSGFTFKRRVGWTYNHSDGDLQNFVQTGLGRERTCYWNEPFADYARIIQNATSLSPLRTAVDCSSRVPPSAHTYVVRCNPGDTSDQARDTSAILPLAVSGSMAGWIYFYGGHGPTSTDAPGAGSIAPIADFPVSRGDGQTVGFDYITYNNGNVSVGVLGWKETV